MKSEISIRESRDRVAALEAAIKAERESLIGELVAAIPRGMRQWFIRLDRVEFDDDRKLVATPQFAVWLENLHVCTVERGLLYGKAYHSDLSEYGIRNFQDMQKKFAELEAAWNGLIKVRLHDGGPASSISIYWAMAEYHDPKDIPIEFQ